MSDAGLPRRLGTLDLALLVAGIIIGAGIFSTPGLVAQHLAHPGWVLVAWGLGGCIALAGALSLSELGAAYPHAGGDYTYLHRCFGPFPAFLYGWLFFTISGTGSIAALAVAGGDYAADLFPGLPPLGVGLALIAGLTVVNVAGLRAGSATQNALTALKFVALGLVVVLSLMAPGHSQPAAPLAGREAAGLPLSGLPLSGLALALVPICFTYMGWNAAGYVGGEVRRPGRSIPRGLLLGTAAVTLLYLVVNAAFLHALAPAEMAGDTLVATRACTAALGDGASRVVSALVLVSIIGCINGMVLAHGRVLYAMAREGHFLQLFARVHPVRRSPDAALWLQGVWASMLMLTGTFERLVGYVTFVMVAMAAAVVIGVFVVRARGTEAPFRAPLHPMAPVFFVVASVWILVGVARFSPTNAVIGTVMAVVGGVVYWIWQHLIREP